VDVTGPQKLEIVSAILLYSLMIFPQNCRIQTKDKSLNGCDDGREGGEEASTPQYSSTQQRE
jgi:hypothetical protein